MALPPKDDPRRPMHLAIRSMRLLGVLFIGLGLCMFVPLMTTGLRGGRLGGASIVAGIAAAFYVLPGAGYFLCAVFLGRRAAWAIVVGLVLASVHMLLVLVSLGTVVFAVVAGGGASGIGVIVSLLVSALVLAALGQLIYHLARSFEAIRYVPVDEQRGFEMSVISDVIPAEPFSPVDRQQPGGR